MSFGEQSEMLQDGRKHGNKVGMKPLRLKKLGYGDNWICRKCKRTVESSYNYCPNCGQKLDWR